MLTAGGLFPWQETEGFSLSQWYQDNPGIQTAAGVVALLLACLIASVVVRKARVSLIRPLIQKSRFTWDDVRYTVCDPTYIGAGLGRSMPIAGAASPGVIDVSS